MSNPQSNRVIALPMSPDRRRLILATAARRRLAAPRPAGRAWVNGREAGGVDPRFTHLTRSHD